MPGGLSKGVEYDELIAAHAQRLKAVLIIGTDTAALKSALANHAPQVPTYNMTAAVADSSDGVAVMNAAVAKAAELAHPGDTVLMAPASARWTSSRIMRCAVMRLRTLLPPSWQTLRTLPAGGVSGDRGAFCGFFSGVGW